MSNALTGDTATFLNVKLSAQATRDYMFVREGLAIRDSIAVDAPADPFNLMRLPHQDMDGVSDVEGQD